MRLRARFSARELRLQALEPPEKWRGGETTTVQQPLRDRHGRGVVAFAMLEVLSERNAARLVACCPEASEDRRCLWRARRHAAGQPASRCAGPRPVVAGGEPWQRGAVQRQRPLRRARALPPAGQSDGVVGRGILAGEEAGEAREDTDERKHVFSVVAEEPPQRRRLPGPYIRKVQRGDQRT